MDKTVADPIAIKRFALVTCFVLAASVACTRRAADPLPASGSAAPGAPLAAPPSAPAPAAPAEAKTLNPRCEKALACCSKMAAQKIEGFDEKDCLKARIGFAAVPPTEDDCRDLLEIYEATAKLIGKSCGP